MSFSVADLSDTNVVMSLDADVTNSSFSVDEEAQNEATEASRT
jgi:hypothetical protein